jgi:peptide/nickel transport system ATP-binding protein
VNESVAVENLRIVLAGNDDDIIDEVSFTIDEGQVLGLVGESGCGKTTTGLALLGEVRRGARIAGGGVTIDGIDILSASEEQRRRLRGRVVAYIPQDPSAALNPALRIKRQLTEVLETHLPELSRQERAERLAEMMREVALPSDAAFLRRYPHQLSGGQQQRVAIAMAFACRPRVIVLDEPTTGLDVTTQAHVLKTVSDLCRSHRVAALYVSHDLAVVADLADRVGVMYAGRLVDIGRRRSVMRLQAHPYTRGLLRAVPDVAERNSLVGIPGRAVAPGARPAGCFFAPRCEWAEPRCHEEFPPVRSIARDHDVRCHRVDEVAATPLTPRIRGVASPPRAETLLTVEDLDAWYGTQRVLQGVALTLQAGECLGVAGESGSGKTTLARCVAGLHGEYSGVVRFAGMPMPGAGRRRSVEMRKRIQYIFQSPYASLNPRLTVGQAVARPIRLFFKADARDARQRARQHLERVGLGAHVLDRYPEQLSGGERQRVAIARALAAEPWLLVCDEITSSLDVSVQGSIVELLEQLRREMGLSLLFVTHDLGLTRTIADRVMVMNHGMVMETGPVEEVFETPSAAYTRELLRDTPSLERHMATAGTAEDGNGDESGPLTI